MCNLQDGTVVAVSRIAMWLLGICAFGGIVVFMGVVTQSPMWLTLSLAFVVVVGWSVFWIGREAFWGDGR